MMALAIGIQSGKWPHTMEARVWADEWAKAIASHPDVPADHDTMIGWFANAIMTGYDTAVLRMKAAASAERPDALKIAADISTRTQFASCESPLILAITECVIESIYGKAKQ